MGSKSIANSTLVLRMLTLFLLAASVVIMATNNFKLRDGTEATFKDVHAYRYVIATAMVGFAYIAFQIPFAIYHVCTDKRLISNDCAPEFDFYGDKIISFLLATGVGAGFAVTFELKKILKEIFKNLTGVDERKSKTFSFLDRGYVASGLLLGGVIFLATLSILSSINRSNNTSKGFFFK